jgi:hypothetical protein
MLVFGKAQDVDDFSQEAGCITSPKPLVVMIGLEIGST